MTVFSLDDSILWLCLTNEPGSSQQANQELNIKQCFPIVSYLRSIGWFLQSAEYGNDQYCKLELTFNIPESIQINMVWIPANRCRGVLAFLGFIGDQITDLPSCMHARVYVYEIHLMRYDAIYPITPTSKDYLYDCQPTECRAQKFYRWAKKTTMVNIRSSGTEPLTAKKLANAIFWVN